MAIEPITFVNVVGKISNLNETLTKIAKSEMFHLEKVNLNSKIKKFDKLNEKNPYKQTLEKINKILKILKIAPRFNNYNSLKSKSTDEIDAIVNNSFEKASRLTQSIKTLKTKISIMEKSLEQLNYLESFYSKPYKIFSTKFVNTCFGRLTLSSYLKLDYFSNKNFFFIPIKNDKNFHWGLFIYSKDEEQEFQKIAKSLYFEKLYSSEQFANDPELTTQKLQTEIENSKNEIESLNQTLNNYKTQYSQTLLCIYSKIKTLYTTFNYRQFAVSNNKFFYINGYVLEKNLKEFTNLFDEFDNVVVETLSTKNKNNENLNLPVKLKTGVLFRPFELLIETFGLPTYGTTNPTSFIGFIYCFLFGLMFGDFGQGGCLFLAGIIFWLWKKNSLGLILTRCAISSCIFGLIYDSCFGFEGFFENFWKNIKIFPNLPFTLLKGKNAITILIVSLIIGMILINISILTNILTNLKNKNYKQATISGNGLAGLLIYGTITTTTVSVLIFKKSFINPIFLCLTMLLPAILIFLEKPIFSFIDTKISNKKHSAEFNFLNSALETFETILNYFTNTLSFLRVGGFAMSHAALMLVVVKFYEKCAGSATGPLIAVFGNIFVIALEGMVVSIQVLRLIYYEMFSRFYKSNGKKFQPAKINF